MKLNTKDSMAKLPGLFQRAGVWTLRVMIPLELQPSYEGRAKIIESLKTGDSARAKVLGTARRAELLEEFQRRRLELHPQKVERVTPEMGRLLAERVTAAVLRGDERFRQDPAATAVLLDGLAPLQPGEALRIGPHPTRPSRAPAMALLGPLDGIPLPLLLELADLNESMDKAAALQFASQRVAAVLPMVKAEARALGLLFDEKAPGAMDALRDCLKAYRRARQDVASRDDGAIVDTPLPPTKAQASQAKVSYLRDVLPQWKASKKRKPQTEQAAENALAMYEKATGNPPLSQLTRAQGVECRAWLLTQGVTAKTAHDRFNYLKGFINFASGELELIPKNPWEGLAIAYGTTTPRAPWSSEQLSELFSRPLFTTYELPEPTGDGWGAGGSAAYWIPLLGLFTGARMGELCQLTPADVDTVDGVAILRITDQGDKSLKTQASRRIVPVHSELIRLGFLEYAGKVKKAGSASLFPALPVHPTKPSNYFSSWFATLRSVEGGNKLPDFHSFRHTVRSKLASAGVAEPLIDTLVGHEVKGSTGAKAYTARSTEDLRVALSALSYPALALPRVYPPKPRR